MCAFELIIGFVVMVRFFVLPSDISDGIIALSAEDAVHVRSLRLRPDELFTVCDGQGFDYSCRLGARGDGLTAEVIEVCPSRGEPSVACSVYIAFAKGDRLDYAVQKSVELGVHDIVLYPSERCVSLPGDTEKKRARFQRIALETAKQCDRGHVPTVSIMGSFKEAVRKAALCDAKPVIDGRGVLSSGLSLFFYEQEEKLHLKHALEQHCAMQVSEGAADVRHNSLDAISIFTGPEGGFEAHEVEFARSAGLVVVSLGPRILRCETAPVVALAAVMFFTDNL